MKKLLTTACLFAVTTVAIVSFIAPIVFGQEQKAAKEWRFDQAQPDWKPALPLPASKTVELERTTDALRVTLSEGSRIAAGALLGGVYIDLADWRREEWADVVVRARTTSSVSLMTIGLNPIEGALPAGATQATFQASGGVTPVVRDGVVRTYRLHLDWGSQRTGPWRRVGLQFQAPEPGSIDILSVRVVPAAAEPAQARVIETMIERPQLKSDFALFRKALEEAHAGLYRWTTKREMDAEFATAEASLSQPMTILQFRNVLVRVVAGIKCGHTEFTDYQGDEISTVLNSAKQFPLALKFESNRAFLVLNQGLDERVKPGMEVLAINGEPLTAILRRIIPNLPHDGDIRTNRRYILGFSRGFHRLQSPGRTGFSESYRLYIGNPASFKTTLRDPHTQKTVVVELAGVTNAEAAVNAEKNLVNRDVLTGIKTFQALGEKQSIRYLDGESTAILRLPGFRDFGDFLAKSFAELRSNGTKHLVIDLRGNSGGSDASVPLLFSYLAAKEFRVYDRIQMTTYQPSFTQYTDREFTPATGFPEFSPDGGFLKPDPSGGWLLTEKKSGNRLYKPAENRFDGAVYVLMDGGSFSATADFVATAAFHKRAIFIGEETGGVAEGNNSGVEIGLTLPGLLCYPSSRLLSPNRMSLRSWFLKCRLRRAARLLRKGAINEWQYSALAVALGHDLINRPLVVGAKVDYFSFGAQLMEQLVHDVSNKAAIERSLVIYGPYSEATIRLKPTGHDDLWWNGDQQNRASSAALYLSPFNRAAFRLQDWWSQQEHIFPVFTKLTVFIMGLVLGAVIGWVSKR